MMKTTMETNLKERDFVSLGIHCTYFEDFRCLLHPARNPRHNACGQHIDIPVQLPVAVE